MSWQECFILKNTSNNSVRNRLLQADEAYGTYRIFTRQCNKITATERIWRICQHNQSDQNTCCMNSECERGSAIGESNNAIWWLNFVDLVYSHKTWTSRFESTAWFKRTPNPSNTKAKHQFNYSGNKLKTIVSSTSTSPNKIVDRRANRENIFRFMINSMLNESDSQCW